jgi:ABC-2 type transport system ATP-binding protein
MTNDPVLLMEHVTKRIDEATLVEDISLQVRQGEIFGFIGPSGSGKTSTIRLLTGVLQPSEGIVRVLGNDPTHPGRNTQERFGYMPQLFVLYPTMTVRENLNFVGGLYGMGWRERRKRIDSMLQFVELWDARDRLARDVSGGMQRRIELASSLLHNPPLLFADEPTAGIDPVLRGKFWEEFRRLRDEGRTLFITTQYVGESEYCDRVGVIRKGRLVALDTPLGLRRTAMGGDAVDIQAQSWTTSAIQGLSTSGLAHRVLPLSPTEVRAYVNDAGPAIPSMLEYLQTINCEVERIEEYRPNFDEVFVELMRRDAEFRGERAGDADGPAR